MPKSFEKAGVHFSVGNQILLKAGGGEKLPYVARIDKIMSQDRGGGHELSVTWYYRPEDVGRRVSRTGARLSGRINVSHPDVIFYP